MREDDPEAEARRLRRLTERTHTLFESFVLCELVDATRTALVAAARLELEFDRVGTYPNDSFTAREDEDNLWVAAYAFLSTSSIVSKLLWPSGKASEESRQRRAQMRRLLDVPEGSPLASRTVRDALEHFDERLEKWTAKAPDDVQIPYKAINRESRAIVFGEDCFAIDPAVDALRRIRDEAEDISGYPPVNLRRLAQPE